MKARVCLGFLVAIFVAALLGACAPAPTSLPPTRTPIPPPTSTLVPTATATATRPPTVTPTATIEPPSILTEYLRDVQILAYDPFDNANHWSWDTRTSRVIDGVFQMEGTSFWASSFSFNHELHDGEGIMLKFEVQKANAGSQFVFVSGAWQTDDFRQFGIDNARRPTPDLWQGKNNLGASVLGGPLTLKPETWYGILMAIGKNGDLLAVMWDPGSEGHRAVYKETVGEKWRGRNWLFMPKATEGETLYVDDFYEFAFGAIE